MNSCKCRTQVIVDWINNVSRVLLIATFAQLPINDLAEWIALWYEIHAYRTKGFMLRSQALTPALGAHSESDGRRLLRNTKRGDVMDCSPHVDLFAELISAQRFVSPVTYQLDSKRKMKVLIEWSGRTFPAKCETIALFGKSNFAGLFRCPLFHV